MISPHRLGLGVSNSLVFVGVALTSSCFGWVTESARCSHFSSAVLRSDLFLVTAFPLVIDAPIYVFSPDMTSTNEETEVGSGVLNL
ncbi:MAG: major Facilitator Superfamily protein [Caballeronia mineralivorans]|jgi:hypothetical protein|nr:major Facilitator Superfamily protein [Caballeronia mineralivorans]MEA3104525.1 hypothetical protein [Caballeronia mineralivorans]